MFVKLAGIALVLSLNVISVVSAQDMAEEQLVLMKAAVVIGTFDHYNAACLKHGGYKSTDANKVDAWQQENQISLIRTRLSEVLGQRNQKQQIDSAIDTIVNQVSQKVTDVCVAAVSMTRTADAQLAKNSPQLLRKPQTPVEPPELINKTAVVSGQVRPNPMPEPTQQMATTPMVNQALLAQIDSFGFNTRLTMGYGGFLNTDIYPVILLRNGELIDDVEALNFAGGLAAHKRAKPDKWTSWRRSGGELQIMGKSGWKKLPFQVTYAKLPDNLKLNGIYRRLGGGGTLAVGGTSAVAVWRQYQFWPDGQVVRGGGAGSQSESGSASVVTQSVAPNQRGHYRVHGLLLKINYDDGSGEQRILITDPKEPNGVIWLDGDGYVQRKK